jgi:penicillin-binding protein 1C
VVVARDGTPLRAFPDREHIWRHPVRVEEVSPRYIEALLAYEDRSFWWHPGVNPWALLRAGLAMAVARAHRLRRLDADHAGGAPARGRRPRARAAGKLRQIARALQLELRLSKREILEIYLSLRRWAACSKASKRPAAPISASRRSAERIRGGAAGRAAAIALRACGRTATPSCPEARDKVLDRLQSRWGAARCRRRSRNR